MLTIVTIQTFHLHLIQLLSWERENDWKLSSSRKFIETGAKVLTFITKNTAVILTLLKACSSKVTTILKNKTKLQFTWLCALKEALSHQKQLISVTTANMLLCLVLVTMITVVSGDPNLPVWPKQFRWSYAGVPAGYSCIQVNEPSDNSSWRDNYFCWEKHCSNPGLWSVFITILLNFDVWNCTGMVNTSVCHSLQKRRFLNPSQPSPQLCSGISLVFPPSPSSPSLQLHDI